MGPVRRGEVLAIWEQCVRDALLGRGEVEDGIRGSLEAMHERIRASLDALPKKIRAGEVRSKVDATILDFRPILRQAAPVREQTSAPPQDKSKAASRRRKAA